MGNRIQKRNKAVLPVRISGVDASGRAFNVMGHTLDFHSGGARLGKIQAALKQGVEVFVQYRNNKVRFTVRWVGPPDTAVAGQLGLQCLESTKDLWPAESQPGIPAPDDFQAVGSDHLLAQDMRFPCSGTVQVRPSRGQKGFSARVGDISAEGCRVLVAAGLPVGTNVSLLLRVAGVEIEASGTVRTCLPGQGMGILFAHFASPADKDRLKLLVHKLRSAETLPTHTIPSGGRNVSH